MVTARCASGGRYAVVRSTDLALRVLVRLAVADEASIPTTRDVAAIMDVRYTHAAKIVAELQHLSLVDARRGRNGGLTLTTNRRTASVGAVLRALEGEGDVVECEGVTRRTIRSPRRAPGCHS